MNKLRQALVDLMAGQKFDGGGHIIEIAKPSHSAILKAKALLDSSHLEAQNLKTRELIYAIESLPIWTQSMRTSFEGQKVIKNIQELNLILEEK